MLPLREPEAIKEIFSDINALLEGRNTVLWLHKIMIAKIKSRRISDIEFKDYLKDEIGIGKALSEAEKTKVIADMEQSIEDAIKIIAQLRLFCSEPIDSVSVLQFYYALTYALHNTRSAHIRSQSSSECWDFKGTIAFNQHLIIKECLKRLDPCLPPTRMMLDSITNVKEMFECTSRQSKKTGTYTTQTLLTLEADRLGSIYKSQRNFITKNIFEVDPQQLQQIKEKIAVFSFENNLSRRDLHLILVCLEKKNGLIMEIERFCTGGDLSQAAWDEQLKYVYALSKPVIKLIELFDQMKVLCDIIVIPSEEKKLAEKLYKEKLLLLKNKFMKIAPRVDFVLQQLKLALKAKYSEEDMLRIEAFKQSIDSAQKELNQYKLQWQIKSMPDNLLSRENVCDLESRTLKSVSALSKLITKVLHELDYMASKADLAKEEASRSSVAEEVPPEVKAEYQQFRQQQVKAIQAYRAQIEEKRAQKRAAKHTEVQPVSVVEETKVQLVKNEEMGTLLSRLNRHQLELLKSILSMKVGEVKYSDVINLITKHLGGEVVEIGSSHKRVKIGKFYTEVNDTGESTVATGGFFRPHGSSHNNGLMSRFNLELVAKTLIKAHITLEVLQELENKLGSSPQLQLTHL